VGATRRRRIEDMMDEALQSLLNGETAETILARYPGYETELTSLLFAANSLKDAPHPQLSQASIAAMVDRAEAQAARDRKMAAAVLLPSTFSSSESGNEMENASQAARARSGTRQARQTWQERVKAWISPTAALLRLPTVLAAVVVVIIALFTMARLLDKPQLLHPSVPTLTAQFTIDGRIEQVANGMWTVDGGVVYLDGHTVITGTPMIGSQAHIEGDIASDNRRIARSIVVGQSVSSTATPRIESVASATPQPTVLTLTEDATPVPREVPTLPPTPALPEITPATPTASGEAGVGTRPSPTIPATSGANPTPIKPTQTVVVLSTPTNIVPTVTESIASPQPTTIKQPSPVPTSSVQPSPTAQSAEPTQTRVPQPEPTATIEVEPSYTPEPQQTHTPEPTREPEDTPQPTATSHIEPTSTVEPEATSTIQPTTVPANTPTTQPTIPPVSSPASTEEPYNTETPEPTHGPESTHTAYSTLTPEPTHTEGR
jgi:hypothetical protein